MNAEEIIKLKKNALYTSLESNDFFGKFFKSLGSHGYFERHQR